MKVTYYSAQGTIRMVYPNTNSAVTRGESLVELQNVERWCYENGKAIPAPDKVDNYYCYNVCHTVALINLAPGEYLEWDRDAERN